MKYKVETPNGCMEMEEFFASNDYKFTLFQFYLGKQKCISKRIKKAKYHH